MKKNKFFRQKRIIFDVLAILIIFGLLIYFAKPLFNFLAQQQSAAQFILKYGTLGPLILIGLEAFQEMVVGLPGITTIAGFAFGPILATIYSLLGGTIGAIIAFYIARLLGRPILERFIGEEKLSKFDNFARGRGGVFTLFLFFLIPFLPDTLACYTAGLSPLSLPVFIIITLLGRFPPVFIAAFLGSKIKLGYSASLLIYLIIIGLFLAVLYLFKNKIEHYLLKRQK